MTSVTLIGKPGCHLCDDARAVILDVIEGRDDVELSELSIYDDPALEERYVEEIPVVLIEGRVHTIWRVSPERFRVALDARRTPRATV